MARSPRTTHLRAVHSIANRFNFHEMAEPQVLGFEKEYLASQWKRDMPLGNPRTAHAQQYQ